MKQLKQVKNKFTEQDVYNEYAFKYKHKQMKFITSKIVLIYNPKVSVDELIKLETLMLKADKGKDMFDEPFKMVEKLTNTVADWKSFSKFMWYVYQTSTFFKDEKKGIKNIFNNENTIKLNEIRRGFFHKWLHSFPENQKNYNENVMQVSNLVF